MPCGDIIGLQHRSPFHQVAEFDLVVASDTGMRSAAQLVLGCEIVHHLRLELPLGVQDIMGDAQTATDGTSVFNVVQCTTTLVIGWKFLAVQVVKLHGNAHNLVTLLLQQ
jgi:hypothetical protein|tara:strand:- start:1206 stop:1535 length:330 start_codon:yes stop_codon:yes gene_type:complete